MPTIRQERVRPGSRTRGALVRRLRHVGPRLEDRDARPVDLLGLREAGRLGAEPVAQPAAVRGHRVGLVSHAVHQVEALESPPAHSPKTRREDGLDEPGAPQRLRGDHRNHRIAWVTHSPSTQTIRSRTTALA
jgi:hypothetical protein